MTAKGSLRASSRTNPWGLTVMQRWALDLLIKHGGIKRAAVNERLSVFTLEEHVRLAKTAIHKRQNRRLTTLQLVVEYALWKASPPDARSGERP